MDPLIYFFDFWGDPRKWEVRRNFKHPLFNIFIFILHALSPFTINVNILNFFILVSSVNAKWAVLFF